jgi:AraC-like DNA-binding protein
MDSIIYSSRDLAGDKQRAWEALVSQIYASLDLRICDGGEFEGRIFQSPFHDLDLTRSITSYEMVRRDRRHIAKDRSQSYVFLFVAKGPLTIEQFGRTAVLQSDCCSILDLGSPYFLRHATSTDTFFLKVPGAVLNARFRDIHAHCAVSRPTSVGMGSIAADLITSLSKHVGEASSDAAACLATQMLDILALTFEAGPNNMPEGPSLARQALRRRAVAYIDRRLGDPSLDPATVAGALGISTRYLHKVFEQSDVSVAAYIRAKRLERAREDLADGRLGRRPIAEIASRNGFGSQSFFATSFKKRFGASPRDIRAAANAPERS